MSECVSPDRIEHQPRVGVPELPPQGLRLGVPRKQPWHAAFDRIELAYGAAIPAHATGH
ncbi:MAG: hypothetical protein ABIX28_18785 [Vicinamibacterales bacterium]